MSEQKRPLSYYVVPAIFLAMALSCIAAFVIPAIRSLRAERILEVRAGMILPAVYHPPVDQPKKTAVYYPEPDLRDAKPRPICAAVENLVFDGKYLVLDLRLKHRNGLPVQLDPGEITLIDPEGIRHLPITVSDESWKKFTGKIILTDEPHIYLIFLRPPEIIDGQYSLTVGSGKPTTVYAFRLRKERQYDHEAYFDACVPSGPGPATPNEPKLN